MTDTRRVGSEGELGGGDPDLPELFRRLEEDPSARDHLAVSFQPLVEYLARRFAGRGEALEDLVQVANIGLLNAIDRFDPDREVQFSTYATATIVGELKRHFRDKAWAVRVPRQRAEDARSGRIDRTSAPRDRPLGRCRGRTANPARAAQAPRREASGDPARLRAALSLFGGILPDHGSQQVKAELRWLTDELGPAREFDVLLAQVVAPLEQRGTEIAGIKSLSEEMCKIMSECRLCPRTNCFEQVVNSCLR